MCVFPLGFPLKPRRRRSPAKHKSKRQPAILPVVDSDSIIFHHRSFQTPAVSLGFDAFLKRFGSRERMEIEATPEIIYIHIYVCIFSIYIKPAVVLGPNTRPRPRRLTSPEAALAAARREPQATLGTSGSWAEGPRSSTRGRWSCQRPAGGFGGGGGGALNGLRCPGGFVPGGLQGGQGAPFF